MPPYRLLTPEELAAIASEHGINSENVRWGLTDSPAFLSRYNFQDVPRYLCIDSQYEDVLQDRNTLAQEEGW